MKEAIAQYTGHGFDLMQESKETMRDTYKINQMVRLKTYTVGAQKERSVHQLNLLMACCQLVADNTDNDLFNTKEKVKFACKVHCHFVVPDVCAVLPNGAVQFQYRSFSFKSLAHMESCGVFEKCFYYMSSLLGITKDELIANAKGEV